MRRFPPFTTETSSAAMFDQLEVAVSFGLHSSILRVGGEVDLLTAPTLRAALLTLADRPGEVVLDLSLLRFMDASGLRVIAETSQRLAQSDRVLRVRSASARTVALLEITGLDEVVHVEPAGPGPAEEDAPRQPARAALRGDASPLQSDTSRPDLPLGELVRELVAMAAAASTAAVDAGLQRLAVLAGATIDGVDGVSVTLERHGVLATVAASNDTVLRMDQHQYQTGEGPCLSAATEGRPIETPSLSRETRWRTFIPLAIDEGIASILSTPVLAAERPVGAVNMYSTRNRPFGPRRHGLAELVAVQIAATLEAAEHAGTSDMADRMVSALADRETIARAQGILMARHHQAGVDAAAALHRAARAAQTTVLEQAMAIIASIGADLESPSP